MAGNSLESLLAWMKDNSRMLGWDVIVALDGRAINRNFEQDHILRLSQGNDLGDIDVAVDIPNTNITHHLSAMKMAAPTLSFDKEASLQRRTADLRLTVVGGASMMVETVQGQNKIIRLSSLDPLDGSQLQLNDLPIDADSHNVQLDLAKSGEVLLTLFHTPQQQREAGKLIRARLEELAAAKRVYPLARFPDKGNPFMTTRSIDVRNHKRAGDALGSQADNGNGALLFFAGMTDGSLGAFPGDNAGFRYLIPDAHGQKSWSGTALFSRAWIHRAAFGHAVLQLIKDGEFERVTGEAGRLTKLVARRGTLQVPAASYRSLDYEFESEPLSLSVTGGASPLTVEFTEDQATQHLQGPFELSFSYRPVGGTRWQKHTATFDIRLEHVFHFSADESSTLGMEGELSAPYTNKQEVSHVSGLPGTIAPNMLQQINDFVAQTIKRAILEQFSETLTALSPDDFLAALTFIGNSTLQPTDAALPFDLAKFGQLQSPASSFSIDAPQLIVAAGKTLQLSTVPARQGLRWSVENLAGSASDPGSITDQGLYQAPPRHAMQGTFNRVLIIARDPLTDEQSVTLITIQANSVTVNPLIQTCFHSERVELSAGSMGTGKLDWAVKDPVSGESGKVVVSPEGDHAYIAAPQVANKSYVLDEIEVSDQLTGQARSAYVLVLQHNPVVTVKPVENPSLPEGQIQLQAIFNGVTIEGTWSLPLGGPGWIDESGLYMDDPTSKEQFVLIYVQAVFSGVTLQGHIILPLPFSDFPTVLEALAE